MGLDEIAGLLRKGLERKPLSDSIKFDCGPDGQLVLSGDQAMLQDIPADCTISLSLPNLEKLIKGKLNPMMAFATGKLKVAGDMTVAMKLSQLLK